MCVKKLFVFAAFLFLAAGIFPQDYIRKYSTSHGWADGASKVKFLGTGGNTVTEVAILEEDKDTITVQIERSKTPHPEIFSEVVMMRKTTEEGWYSYHCMDHRNTQIQGYFYMEGPIAYFVMNGVNYSENGGKVSFLYDDDDSFTIMFDSSDNPDFYDKAVHVSEVKSYLTQLGTYWMKDTENAYLFLNYDGAIDDLEFYDSQQLLAGSQDNAGTRRLIILKNGEYIGNYSGIKAEFLFCNGSEVWFYDEGGVLDSTIDFSSGIPEQIVVCGYTLLFQE